MSAARPSGSGPDAIVIGSGANGLAAAVVLARAGLAVEVLEAEETAGGGARTLDLGLAPGIVHDICSAVHPMALASPFFRAFDLAARGVEMRVPEASYAQPLDGMPAAIAWRDLERTAAELGADGPSWSRLLGPLAERADLLADLALGDKRSLPRSALSPAAWPGIGGLGVGALLQGTPAWGAALRTAPARALLTGVAAHVFAPLPSLSAGGVSMLLAALGHAGGWPIPVSGSQAIADALIADLRAHGGAIRTGAPVRTWRDLPPAALSLFDTSARTAADVLVHRLPQGRERALRTFPPAQGAAAKVDFVTSAPVPWRDPRVGRAGTVHLGGTREEMAAAEAEAASGRMPRRPVTLVSDPGAVDPSRIHGGLRPIWAYAHVPLGDPRDPVELVTAQIERFAPGFRDTVVAARGISASRMADHDRALLGGDISMGSTSLLRMVARPTAAPDPYRLLGADARGGAAYLCSAAAPPGPGVHGMGGLLAARRALRDVFGIRRLPDLQP